MFWQGKPTPLFGGARALESQIDEFFDKSSEAGIVFSTALNIYLREGANEAFDQGLHQAVNIETQADNLRREIERELYIRTLIPDLRADVLALLEAVDHLINIYEGNLYRFSIQRPDISNEFHSDFNKLVSTVVDCVDTVVLAARSFFRDIEAVRDHSSKAIFLETEADKVGTKLQRAIFDSDLPLENKMHLRYFVERIDQLANSAEDVADIVQIYAIKRRV